MSEINIGANDAGVEIAATETVEIEVTFQTSPTLEFHSASQVIEIEAQSSPTIEVVAGAFVPDWVQNTSITVSKTAPQNPQVGDLWIDTN